MRLKTDEPILAQAVIAAAMGVGMKLVHVIAALPLLFGSLSGKATAQLPSASVRISRERMSEMTRVLASDEFEGRCMGTRG